MRNYLFTFAACLLFAGTMKAQDTDGNPPEELVKYYFVEFLSVPDKPTLPKHQEDSLQRGHMAYLGKMVEDEILLLAGPFEGGGGILVLKLDTKEEAIKLMKGDPLVANKRLGTKIRAWWTAKGAFTLEEKFKKNQLKN